MLLNSIKAFDKKQLNKVQTVVRTTFIADNSVSQIYKDNTANAVPGFNNTLFIGSVKASHNKQDLQKNKITHILTVVPEFEPKFPNDYVYKCVYMLDVSNIDIRPYLVLCFEFLDQALKSGGRVLVHCQMGVSRSATVVIAYSMKTLKKTFEQALNDLKKSRPVVQPNYGFLQQLKKLDGNFNLEIKSEISDIKSHLENRDAIDYEFRTLDVLDEQNRAKQSNFKTALLPENMKKNRYSTVLASESLGISQDYIVTQGPLESTCEDFWTMVWEYSVPLIVMLTKEQDSSGKEKCFKYWPSEGKSSNYGDLSIENCSETNMLNEIIQRTLKLTYKGETKIIHQLQYLAWPDHGAPKDTSSFHKLLDQTRDLISDKKGPLIVHCSSGIGGTGVFCTIHSILQKYNQAKKNNQSFNVFETVKKMKQQRTGMVDQLPQYIFCYTMLRDLQM